MSLLYSADLGDSHHKQEHRIFSPSDDEQYATVGSSILGSPPPYSERGFSASSLGSNASAALQRRPRPAALTRSSISHALFKPHEGDRDDARPLSVLAPRTPPPSVIRQRGRGATSDRTRSPRRSSSCAPLASSSASSSGSSAPRKSAPRSRRRWRDSALLSVSDCDCMTDLEGRTTDDEEELEAGRGRDSDLSADPRLALINARLERLIAAGKEALGTPVQSSSKRWRRRRRQGADTADDEDLMEGDDEDEEFDDALGSPLPTSRFSSLSGSRPTHRRLHSAPLRSVMRPDLGRSPASTPHHAALDPSALLGSSPAASALTAAMSRSVSRDSPLSDDIRSASVDSLSRHHTRTRSRSGSQLSALYGTTPPPPATLTPRRAPSSITTADDGVFSDSSAVTSAASAAAMTEVRARLSTGASPASARKGLEQVLLASLTESASRARSKGWWER